MMNSPDHDKDLLEKIEAYFDCSLSDEEEQDLRRRIAATNLRHPAVDEARALMGFARQPEAGRAAVGRSRRIVRRGAASVAVAAAAAVAFVIGTPKDDNHCYAYVDGRKVTDEEAVMALLEVNIREAGESETLAELEMMADLSSVAKMVEMYESDNQLYL